MKKSLLPSLFAVICSIFLSAHTPLCFAEEESGCFTCHRYPGLVRSDKNQLKPLHIDEQAFVRSPHGKLSCKQCHTNIVKVPHTGQNAVQCITPSCHGSDKDRAMVANYPLETLHDKEQFLMVTLQDDSSCRACHALYPHSQNTMVRALLNMHTGFMTCESCHIKRAGLGEITYQWKGPEPAVFTGRPYGFRYAPQTGVVRTTENTIWRLAISVTQEGEKRMFTHREDTDAADRFLSEEKKMGNDDKKKRLDFFHRNILRKEISVACKECHSPNGILDFLQLGFDKKTSNYLMDLDLPGLVAKYEIFYFPDLFGH